MNAHIYIIYLLTLCPVINCILLLLNGILHAILFTVYIVSHRFYIHRTNINAFILFVGNGKALVGLTAPGFESH